jgi:hypothetical protein
MQNDPIQGEKDIHDASPHVNSSRDFRLSTPESECDETRLFAIRLARERIVGVTHTEIFATLHDYTVIGRIDLFILGYFDALVRARGLGLEGTL